MLLTNVNDITDNIKSALTALQTYGGVVDTVERERLFLNFNGRFPFILVAGPDNLHELEGHLRNDSDLKYEIKYYIDHYDEDEIVNNEISFVTRNVCSDIIDAVLIDQTRGGYATKTRIMSFGPAFELVSEMPVFFRYVIFVVEAQIDMDGNALS